LRLPSRIAISIARASAARSIGMVTLLAKTARASGGTAWRPAISFTTTQARISSR
jgi:hypothetical protein